MNPKDRVDNRWAMAFPVIAASFSFSPSRKDAENASNLLEQRGLTAKDLWPVILDGQFPLWEHGDVGVVSEKRIREFIAREPRSAESMWNWLDAVESASWRNPGDLKRTFSATASFVGDKTIFNVGGNNCRVETYVHYRKQIVYIKRIGTHKKYDKWDL